MISERYQVSGVPVDGGERVTGYYIVCWGMDYIMPKDAVYSDDEFPNFIQVDPATIEPVRVRPIVNYITKSQADVNCPNCESLIFRCFMIGDWNESQKRHEYCKSCGMALDWSEPTRLDDLMEE